MKDSDPIDPGLKYVKYCEVNPAWASRDLVELQIKVKALEEEVAIYKQLAANALG